MARFLIFLLLFSITCAAQPVPVSVQKSPLFKDEYKQSVFVLAEKATDGGMLFVRYYESGGISPGEGLYIERYGPDLNLQREFEFSASHPNHEKYNMIVGVFSSADIIQVIEIYYDLNEKSVICRANTIGANFSISKKELFRMTKDELQQLGSFSLQEIYFDRSKEMWTNNNSGDITSETDLSQSSDTFPRINSNIFMVVDESKTGFAVALDIKQSKSKELKLYAFDRNLEKKIDTNFTRDAKDNDYIFENIQVSKDGNAIYVLGKSYPDDLRKKKIGGKYHFELSKITATTSDILKIDPKEHFIGSLKPFLHKDEIVCLGFFSDYDDQNIIGMCHFKTNLDLAAQNIKFNVFPPQLFLDKYGLQKDGKYKALSGLVFRNISFTENGDMLVSAEEERILTSSSGVGIGVGTKTKLTYNNDDIVSAKLNANGQLLWARNINKNQMRADEDSFFISYTSFVKNDTQYFFINADEKVKEFDDKRIEFGQVPKDKSNLTLLRVNPVGTTDVQKILDHAENPVPFMVSKGITIGDDVYFLGRKNKEKQLLKVTLK